MKPYEYDSRNFRRNMPVRAFFHRNRIAGRLFAITGLAMVLPIHAIAGAVKAIADDGLDEFRTLLRMAFAGWNDRNPNPSP